MAWNPKVPNYEGNDGREAAHYMYGYRAGYAGDPKDPVEEARFPNAYNRGYNEGLSDRPGYDLPPTYVHVEGEDDGYDFR